MNNPAKYLSSDARSVAKLLALILAKTGDTEIDLNSIRNVIGAVRPDISHRTQHWYKLPSSAIIKGAEELDNRGIIFIDQDDINPVFKVNMPRLSSFMSKFNVY